MFNYSKLKLSTHYIIILLVLVIYGVLSIILSWQKPIWRDEAFSSLLSQQNLIEIIKSTSLDYNPPLFYFLLHIWQRSFGFSIVLQRLLPLVFSILTILSILISFPKLLKLKSTLFKYLMLFFLITNGSIFYYSYELRPYSMFMLFSYLSLYWGINYVQQSNNRSKILFTTSSIILLYTQSLGIVWFGIVVAGLIIYQIINKNTRNLGELLITCLLIFCFYLPWLITIIQQYRNFAGSFWLEFKPEEKLYNLSATFAFNEGPLHLPIQLYKKIYANLYYFLIIILVFNLFKKGIVRLVASLIIITLLILYYVSYYKPIFYGRYFVFLAPLVSILTAYLFYCLLTGIINIGKKKTFVVFSMGILFYVSNLYYLWNDYLLGVARVNYKLIKESGAETYYTTSDLDIMPCMMYQKNCYLINNKREIKNYTGILQLQRRPILNSWQQINGNSIAIITRDNDYEEVKEEIYKLGYKQQDELISMGDNTYLALLKK